jgi:U4/U6 small nuclear ribonucleoprotein PRP31
LQFIRDHYSVRFPELEQIIADPWDYINAVRSIGNAEDLTKPKTPLGGRHGLGVSMTASISRGRMLSSGEWQVIEKACDVAVELRDAREKASHFCEFWI